MGIGGINGTPTDEEREEFLSTYLDSSTRVPGNGPGILSWLRVMEEYLIASRDGSDTRPVERPYRDIILGKTPSNTDLEDNANTQP